MGRKSYLDHYEIYRLYEAGFSSCKIAKTTGASISTICRLLKKKYGEVNSSRVLMDIEKATSLYGVGWPITDIADYMKVSPGLVRRVLSENGVVLRNCKEATDARHGITLDNDEIVRLYNLGWSAIRIGRTLCVSDKLIGKRLREVGCKIRSRSEARKSNLSYLATPLSKTVIKFDKNGFPILTHYRYSEI